MTYSNHPVRIHEIRTPFIEPVASLAEQYFEEVYPTSDSVHRRMVTILGLVVLVAMILLAIRPAGPSNSTAQGEALIGELGQLDELSVAGETVAGSSESNSQLSLGDSNLSPIFTKEVQYWADKIVAWSKQNGVEPNMAAVIMQVESCGDPQAVSVAGASGLFQVMPFHFQSGEDMFNPDINAMRGLRYFAERLVQTSGDIGRAFAGYNGGHVAAAGSWDSWADETQRYYVWTTGIYEDINAGLTESPTLQRWLAAGGAGLCQQAAQRLGI